MEDRRCRLGLAGRRRLVELIEEQGATVRAAAAALGVAPSTAQRWAARWRAASPAQRASWECLRARAPRPKVLHVRSPSVGLLRRPHLPSETGRRLYLSLKSMSSSARP